MRQVCRTVDKTQLSHVTQFLFLRSVNVLLLLLCACFVSRAAHPFFRPLVYNVAGRRSRARDFLCVFCARSRCPFCRTILSSKLNYVGQATNFIVVFSVRLAMANGLQHYFFSPQHVCALAGTCN